MLHSKRIDYYISFYDTVKGDYDDYKFHREVSSEFNAITYAIDWVQSKLKRNPDYELSTIKVEDCSIIEPTNTQSVLLWIEEY